MCCSQYGLSDFTISNLKITSNSLKKTVSCILFSSSICRVVHFMSAVLNSFKSPSTVVYFVHMSLCAIRQQERSWFLDFVTVHSWGQKHDGFLCAMKTLLKLKQKEKAVEKPHRGDVTWIHMSKLN